MQSQTIDVVINNWKGKVFYNPHFPTARKDAESYAQPHGKILSLPELIEGIQKTVSLLQYTYTSNSEEDILHSSQGKKYLYIFHGSGILTAKRAALAYKRKQKSVPAAAFLTLEENNNLLEGKLADGREVPIYSTREFWRTNEFPEKYAIALDAKTARRACSGRRMVDQLYEDPLFVPRIGSPARAAVFLDLLKSMESVFHSRTYGNWHPYHEINFYIPQARVLYLGVGTNGICSVFAGFGGFPALKTQILEELPQVRDKIYK